MHSNVQKRAARSSRLEVQSGNSTTGGAAKSSTSDGKRRRRLRRKQSVEYIKSQRRLAYMQATLAGIFLLAVSAYAVSTVKQRRAEYRRLAQEEEEYGQHKGHEHDLHGDRDEVAQRRKEKWDPSYANPGARKQKKTPPRGSRERLGGGIKKLIRMNTYEHSDIMEDIGDKTLAYAKLREEYDALLPEDDQARIQASVDALRLRAYGNMMEHDMPYDVHDCPAEPPADYPYAWNVQDVLENWGPDDPAPRENIYQGICTFDMAKDPDAYEKALAYREAEVPFVIRNDPVVSRTVERWNQPKYMEKLMGKIPHRTEYSPNNHFMYWQKPKKKARRNGLVPRDWEPPTEMLRMPYSEWLEHATVEDDSLLGPDMEHWYYRLIGCGAEGKCDKDSSEYLFDELPFFQPRDDNELYMVEPDKQKGIHCRFGMKGVIAENHFDGSRNMIAVLGGERRYILSHPEQCENLCLFGRGHPSARHSAVDWSDPDYDEFPKFREAEVNEIIMQAGDVLYLPTNWFHYIISLELNFQCNTRSGISEDYMQAIEDCGF